MLEEILAHKRREVAARKARRSFESLLGAATPSDRDFAAALRRRPGFILEIKTASPSAGALRDARALEPVFDAYRSHADAVSVLTDQRFFGGSLDRLAQARTRLPQPLLCKDFILEPYQVVEARCAGADAVLLILSAVDDAGWRASAALAARLGMAVLTEVHDETELRRALALDAGIIGINNRDLRTLRIDGDTTARLAPLVPSDRIVVAESGIASRADVEACATRADAMLIGSAIMGSADPGARVRELVYGRTKICGLATPSGAMAAAAAGATHGGLVFAEGSPRRVARVTAAALREAGPLEWVGVFTDGAAERIGPVARELGLAAVQLHGVNSAGEIAAVRRVLPERCAIWRAVPAGSPGRTDDRLGADRLLLDDSRGRGRAFDWSSLSGTRLRNEVILAGGLTPANAERAAALGMYALDVSSGVECAPGRKDPGLMRAFLRARRRLPGRAA